MNRFVNRVATGAGVFVLCGMPAMSQAQDAAPPAALAAHKAAPAPRAVKAAAPMDDFAGLQYTDDQKTKIRHIHEDIKARMDGVVKSDKLSPEQKGAMLQGYAFMERRQVYGALRPDQQLEVRKRTLARRAEEQKTEQKKQPVHVSPVPPQPPQSQSAHLPPS
jgi:hypothetical protein